MPQNVETSGDRRIRDTGLFPCLFKEVSQTALKLLHLRKGNTLFPIVSLESENHQVSIEDLQSRSQSSSYVTADRKRAGSGDKIRRFASL